MGMTGIEYLVHAMPLPPKRDDLFPVAPEEVTPGVILRSRLVVRRPQ